MASFDSVIFGERGNGGRTFPSQSAGYLGVVQRIPGGSRVVLQQSADREYVLKTTAKTDYAGYLALVNKVGGAGALELGAQRGTATLIAVDRSSEICAEQIWFVDLSFALVTGGMVDTPEAEGGYGFWYGSNGDGM